MTTWARAAGILLPTVLLFLAAGSTLFLEVPMTFNATVQTERIQIVVSDRHRVRWSLSGARMKRDCDGDFEAFSDSFEPAGGALLIFERIALGPLKIYLESAGEGGVGKIYSADDFVAPLGDCVLFQVSDLKARAAKGASLILPFRGKVEIGRELPSAPIESFPVLRSGTVSILGTTILGDSVYTAGSFELDVGDRFEVFGRNEQDTVESTGFVLVNEWPVFTAVSRSVGWGGRVARYGARGYEVGLSVWERISNDGVLQSLWVTFGFASGLVAAARRLRRRSEEEK